MKIGIVGLGLIGASYAKALGKYSYEIYGIDQNIDVLAYALNKNIITKGSTIAKDILPQCDVVFLCLYPKDIVSFVKKNLSYFKNNAIISDVSGVKRFLYDKLDLYLKNDIEFVFAHPIAGKELPGIKNSDEMIFHNANFVITPTLFNNEESINLIEVLAYQMGFSTVTKVPDYIHDDLIAYTSQLTHAIAIALVNSGKNNTLTSKFIGDSYKDLTRIANINESLWAELFILNKGFLNKHIDSFIASLIEIKTALSNNDSDKLKEVMTNAKANRRNLS